MELGREISQWMRYEGFARDVRFGLRMMFKNPGFSVAVIATLTLAIGGNTAIFTVTNALLLKPLAYRDPQQLVLLATQRRGAGSELGGFSLNRYDLLRSQNQSFSGLVVFAGDSFNLTGRGEPQQVQAARVSGNFFDVLGVKPQLGRSFVSGEDEPSGKPVVMISNAIWHSRFGGAGDVVGQSIILDSAAYTVVGVLPADFKFPFMAPVAIWSPRYFEYSYMPAERLRAGVSYLQGIARLKAGSSIQSSSAEMDVLNRAYIAQYPQAPDSGTRVSMVVGDLQELAVGSVHKGLLLLSGAVGVLLLIACANVASLLLSRGLARKKEIAVRAALGASRGAVVRQLLTESILLALISGLLGLGLAFAATRSFANLTQEKLFQSFAVTIDVRVLGFALCVSIIAGVAFGLFPASQISAGNFNQTLRDEGRGSTSGSDRSLVRSGLVVGQVALSLVLVICASLLARSFSRLLQVDPGFDPHNVLTMSIGLSTVKYAKAESQVRFFDELLRKIKVLPGVQQASISAALPLSPVRMTPVLPEGEPDVPIPQRSFFLLEVIGPDFLGTMRIPLRSGRDFTSQDTATTPRVAIVNEAFARRFWPDQNCIGKHIIVAKEPSAEIVGVVSDIRNRAISIEPQPQVYLPFAQLPWPNMNLYVRTTTEPHALISALRAPIAEIDQDQPITAVQTVDEWMVGLRSQSRMTLLMLGTFSITALALATIGIYGLLAYSVAQRRQELGIRMALGAVKRDIVRLVVGRAISLTLGGIVLGVLAAAIVTRVMASLLYRVGAHDPATFTLVPLLFLGIALVTSYWPARRATQVQPTECLK